SRASRPAGTTRRRSSSATASSSTASTRRGDAMTHADVNRRVLPGFAPSLGYAVLYVSLLVLVPMAAGVLKASTLPPAEFWAAVSAPRAVAAYSLTLGASAVAAVIDIALGGLVAWVLVRYEFAGKRLVDALVDFPFALPTAVAGLVYSALYVESGWYGRF